MLQGGGELLNKNRNCTGRAAAYLLSGLFGLSGLSRLFGLIGLSRVFD
jgi:hypothetical protein